MFNWEREIEKLRDAYARAEEDRDVYTQERLSEEIRQCEEIALEAMLKRI